MPCCEACMLINLIESSSSNGSLPLHACLFFFNSYSLLMQVTFRSYVLYKIEDNTLMPFFASTLSKDQNFVLCWLIVLVSRLVSPNIINFTLFSTSHKNYPSTRYAAAANLVCNDTDIFNKQVRAVKQIIPLVFSLTSHLHAQFKLFSHSVIKLNL